MELIIRAKGGHQLLFFAQGPQRQSNLALNQAKCQVQKCEFALIT